MRRDRRKRRLLCRIRKILTDAYVSCLLALPGILMVMPVILLLSGSLMSAQELKEAFGPLWEGDGWLTWRFLPHYPTLSHYIKLLFFTPQFLNAFWNSVFLVTAILFFQLLLAVPAAWAFAVYRFRFSRFLFTVYIVLMLMPFQVTMLSQYIILNDINVMNTHLALLIPAAFSTFPVFLIYRGFCDIPRDLLEAGRIDGAGELGLFLRMGLPLSSGSILAAGVLGFLEYWNMIEQPLAFLQDQSLWPLSLYLPADAAGQEGEAFAASVILLLPAVFVFLLGREYLEKGIVASALKE